ncbi:MAG: hypothetical protein GKR91_16660 [Pseudomonadales bacterium]|nr:hypothetical protein [Pseudomonadales bacterium]
MADAETLNEIVELVVGMVDAAPGADILAELEVAVDAGASVADLAIAIAANPVWSGDTGLFPDFLPNAIFADQWITQLMGGVFPDDEDGNTDPLLQAAIDEMTALLNADVGRGEAMYSTIVALAATTDADYADASAALVNKTAVASYYSIDVAQSSEDLDDLIGVVEGVDETEESVDDATDAVDGNVAANQELSTLVSNLSAADAAVDDLLDDIDMTAGEVGTAVTDAEDVIDGLIVTATAADADTVDAAADDYNDGSDAIKAALISDAEGANDNVLETLSEAVDDAQELVDDEDGLESASNVYVAAFTSMQDAYENEDLAAVALADAVAVFDATAANITNGFTATDTAGGTYSDGTDPIIEWNTGMTALILSDDVDETTHPGVTDLLNASTANVLAGLAVTAAEGDLEDALDEVENIEAAAAADADLAAVGTYLDANPLPDAATDYPTVGEIAATAATLDAGILQLDADLEAVTFDTDDATTLANVTAILTAAAAAGFLDTGTPDNITDLLTAFGDDGTDDDDFATPATLEGAIDAVQAALAAESADFEFDTLVAAHTANGDTGVLADADDFATPGLATDALATAAPIALGLIGAQVALAAQAAAITALADAIDELGEAEENSDALAALNLAAIAAAAAFDDAGFNTPVDLDSAVKAATSDDDVFLADGIDSQIISFADGDTLYVGDGYVLNEGDLDDDGDDTQLEVFFDGADVIIETSVFGSNAAQQEIITISLTGVDTDDLALDTDGFVAFA